MKFAVFYRYLNGEYEQPDDGRSIMTCDGRWSWSRLRQEAEGRVKRLKYDAYRLGSGNVSDPLWHTNLVLVKFDGDKVIIDGTPIK